MAANFYRPSQWMARKRPICQVLVTAKTHAAVDCVTERISKMAFQLGLPDVALYRSYGGNYAKCLIPDALRPVSKAEIDQPRMDQFQVVTSTIDHCGNFNKFRFFVPHMILFEEASMTSFYDMCTVLGRHRSNQEGEFLYSLNAAKKAILDRREKDLLLKKAYAMSQGIIQSAAEADILTGPDAVKFSELIPPRQWLLGYRMEHDNLAHDPKEFVDKDNPAKERCQKSGRVFSIGTFGDFCQLGVKAFVMPPNLQLCCTPEQLLKEFELTSNVKHLEHSIHSLFWVNLPSTNKAMLTMVYRGCQELYQFNFDCFYNNLPPHLRLPDRILQCRTQGRLPSPLSHLSPALADYFVVIVKPPSARILKEKKSRASVWEAETVVKMAFTLRNAYPTGTFKIVTPYHAQRRLIWDEVRCKSAAQASTISDEQLVEVMTGDSAQGSEADFVFLSMGRTKTHSLGFLRDKWDRVLRCWMNGRFNVMTSRQRKGFIMLCDVDSLTKNLQAEQEKNADDESQKASDIVGGIKMADEYQSVTTFLLNNAVFKGDEIGYP